MYLPSRRGGSSAKGPVPAGTAEGEVSERLTVSNCCFGSSGGAPNGLLTRIGLAWADGLLLETKGGGGWFMRRGYVTGCLIY